MTRLAGAEPLALLGLADLAAMVVVFIGSLAADNSSLYDPYWSVAPLAIALFWLSHGGGLPGNLRAASVVLLVCLWGGRLTWNWLRRWQGLAHEDWRYVDLRTQWGRLYWPVSFLGIHLVPTAIVFLGCLPLRAALSRGALAVGWLDLPALVMMGGGLLLETMADDQLYHFQRRPRPAGALLDRGLWSWCRHPNYLGELLCWWGLWLFGTASTRRLDWTAAGPLVMTALFLGISIPLKERRMAARRPGFADYRRRVPTLIPWSP